MRGKDLNSSFIVLLCTSLGSLPNTLFLLVFLLQSFTVFNLLLSFTTNISSLCLTSAAFCALSFNTYPVTAAIAQGFVSHCENSLFLTQSSNTYWWGALEIVCKGRGFQISLFSVFLQLAEAFASSSEITSDPVFNRFSHRQLWASLFLLILTNETIYVAICAYLEVW